MPFLIYLSSCLPRRKAQEAEVTGVPWGKVPGIIDGKIEEEMKEEPLEAGAGIALCLEGSQEILDGACRTGGIFEAVFQALPTPAICRSSARGVRRSKVMIWGAKESMKTGALPASISSPSICQALAGMNLRRGGYCLFS